MTSTAGGTRDGRGACASMEGRLWARLHAEVANRAVGEPRARLSPGRRCGRGRLWSAAALAACLCLAGAPASAQEVAAAARQVADRFQEAVVTVRVVVKTTYSEDGETEQEEEQADYQGTVIDPSGLAVTSLLQMDPSEIMRRTTMGEAEAMTVESQITDARIRLADGTELPARVVLRDNDLDLLFVRPAQKPERPLAAVDLAQSSAAQVMEEVVSLNRLGGFADWVIAPRLARIEAILTKPRVAYLPVMQVRDQLGTPAFTLEGKVVGISVIRLPASPTEDLRESILRVIMPAADILEVAKQVPQ